MHGRGRVCDSNGGLTGSLPNSLGHSLLRARESPEEQIGGIGGRQARRELPGCVTLLEMLQDHRPSMVGLE